MSKARARLEACAIAACCASLTTWSARRANAADAAPLHSLSVSGLVSSVSARNPTIAAAVCDRRGAALGVQGEAARYGFVLQLDSYWTHTASPTLAAGLDANSGIVINGTQNIFDVGAELKKHLVYGTDLALRFDGTRQTSTTFFPVGSLGTGASAIQGLNADGTIETRLGPGYGGSLKLSAVQPFLRGAGRSIAEAGLRVARVNFTTAELIQQRTASEIMRDALSAYWESWYASAAVDIQRRSHEVARAQNDDAEARIRTGSLAPVEGLTFESDLSSRAEDIVAAESQRQRQLAELSRLLGGAEPPGLLNIPLDAPPTPPPPPDNASEDALRASPELRVLQSQVKLATEQAAVAADALRPRLDLDAYVQVQGLGYNDVPAAMKQFGGLSATSAHVGLTFELPLDDTQHRSERQRALFALDTSIYKLSEGRRRLLSELQVASESDASARERIAIAERSIDIALRRAAAEHNRFATGSSTAVQVLEAENAVRAAELRSARAKADLIQAHLRIAYLTGHLLDDLGQNEGLDHERCSPNPRELAAQIFRSGNF